MIKVKKTDRGYLVYFNSERPKYNPVRVWEEDLESIGEVCKLFHKHGSTLACDRLTKHDYSHDNLHATLQELLEIKRKLDNTTRYEDEDEDAQDDYVDLLTAIEDLSGIIGRIEAIET